jgi:hypothetical protein
MSPRWVLVWDDDDTLRPPALPVRCLEDELVGPALDLNLAAEKERDKQKAERRRLLDSRRLRQRAAERRDEIRRAMLAEKIAQP